jgi:hypothetical protein
MAPSYAYIGMRFNDWMDQRLDGSTTGWINDWMDQRPD